MSIEDSQCFFHDGTPCNVSIQDDTLMIRGTAENGSQTLLPICLREVLSVKVVGAENAADKQTFNLKRKLKLPHISIKTIKRYKDHRWKLINVKLKSKYETLCQQWAKTLLQNLSEFGDCRPRSLLVFINPYGGNGSAESVYEKKVKPIFDEAEIKTQVMTTSFRHHAKSYIENNDLSDYNGIIAVGGDGMLNEVVNGLISKTQTRNGISINTKKGEPRNCPEFLRPNLRVGIIPAGSTDCVSYVTQGINDAETSALHIALGDSHPVDVVSLHNADGEFQQFSMSMTGYGYFGDMLRHSENYRWMGPPRYTFVGANVFLRNKSYSGEVHYLPADKSEDPRSSSFCRTPCPVCKGGLTDTETPLFTPVARSLSCDNYLVTNALDNVRNGEHLNDDGAQTNLDPSADDEFLSMKDAIGSQNDTVIAECEINEAEGDDPHMVSDVIEGVANDQRVIEIAEEIKEDQSTETLMEAADQKKSQSAECLEGVDSTSVCVEQSISPLARPASLNLNQEEKRHEHEEWKVISGDFMSVKGVAMSCACEKAPLGLSPYSHLSDGAIDLIVVRSCSRLQFLRYMIAVAGKSDRFSFPYVEVHRVKAFQFIPSTPDVHLPSDAPTSPPRPATPGSNTDTSCSESVNISLDNLSVEYRKSSVKKSKKRRSRGLKRSQSMVSSRVSSWNSDGEILSDPNMTVRVHRGLILMFCRGVEEISGK